MAIKKKSCTKSKMHSKLVTRICKFLDGKLCLADVENLKKWTFNATMADAGMLTQQGERDLHFLAQRIKTRFPELFKQDYSPGLYQVSFDQIQRSG